LDIKEFEDPEGLGSGEREINNPDMKGIVEREREATREKKWFTSEMPEEINSLGWVCEDETNT